VSAPNPGSGSSNNEKIGSRFERWPTTFLLLAMIALPAASTALRRFAGRDLPGASILAQHITLWIGFLGALLATATGRHLGLSTQELLPAGWPRQAARLYANAISAATVALLGFAALSLVRSEWDSNGMVALGIREPWSQLVMPIGFAAMAFRFAWVSGEGRWRWLERAGVLAFAAAAFLLGHTQGSPGLALFLSLLVVVAFLLGAPVFVAMGGVGMALFFMEAGPEGIAAVPTAVYNLSRTATLPAIPLLTIAGYVLAEGGAAARLVRAYKGLFGWMPGGVAVMVTFVCAVFTTFTGASGVTILALGGLVLPMMLDDKYPEPFSVGLVTAAGSLGLLFPPSLPVILYGVVANAPIDKLFIGGFVPGMIMILLVAAYGIFTGVKAGAPRPPFDGREAARALWAAKWDLGLPTLVVVAVGTGFATIVEAAAIAAAYSIIVEVFILREVHATRDLPRVLVHGAALVGSVLILLGAALGATGYLVDAEIPTRLVEWMTTHVKSPALFLLMLNAVLLVLGSVLEIYSAIVVIAPLLAPLGAAYGIEPIHLGVVFLANLELGFLFPPMGLNLFLSASRFGKPLPYIYKRSFPFLIIMSVGVLLITYLPALTTGVVRLFER
jgi:tripartite ATP-independent transporter DctM subunit